MDGTMFPLMPATSILIVEDEAVVALDLQDELQRQGYTVIGPVDSADQAIAMARLHRPSLALVDIALKGDGDGVTAAEALRHAPGTPVIFLTSYSDSATVDRAARAAPYGYLTKPFQIKELRAGIEVALWKSRMERQLREADRWFALTLHCVHDGVIAVDEHGVVKLLNPAAERLTGWRSDEAAGMAVQQLIRFAEPDRTDPQRGLIPLLDGALHGGVVTGVRHGLGLLRRDGSCAVVDASAGPIPGEHGERLGAVLVLRDAAARLQHEALLQASEERFRNAFDAAPLGMALVAMDGRFLQVNEALCRLLARPSAQLLGRPQASLTPVDDLAHEQARLDALQADESTVVQYEKRYLRAGADPVWVLVSASLLRDGDAAVHLYQVHDLTAQKIAATQLAELAAERIRRESSELASRSKNETLSRISHEMRTPLNAVLGFAELLKRRDDADRAVVTSYAGHIVDAGKHLLALVEDVLDMQRAADGSLRLNMTAVALDQSLADTLPMLAPMAEARAVRIEQSLQPGLVVRADATRLRQVLLNIGSNAVKYNVQGGHVRFGAARTLPGRVTLEIEDSGIGMSDEQLQHLFEPFNRLGREALNVPGVGLGLVITHKLVEQMGGRLVVRRGDGSGICVTLELAEA